MKAEDRGEILRARMSAIREKRLSRVADLQIEAERLTDWREHVRASPMAALLGSAIFGFLIFSSRKAPQPAPPQMVGSFAPPVPQRSGIMPQVASFLTGIALNTGKRFLLNKIASTLGSLHHEPIADPTASTEEQRPRPIQSHHPRF